METVEAEGDSVDAAIQTALAKLGVARDAATIEVVNEARRGFFGLGARKARVRAFLRPGNDAERDDRGSDVAPHPSSGASGASGAGIAAAMVVRASEVLQTIVSHFDVGATVTAHDDGDHIVLRIDGDSSGLLIGRKGQTLDALEYIVGRILAREEQRTVHLVVDTEGYRDRRRESLEAYATRMAAEAKRHRRPVTLDPMSPRDRRVVHMALQRDPELTTRSVGDGHERKLIIVPQRSGRSASR